MFKVIADTIVYSLLGLEPATRVAEMLDFFIYDYTKIMFYLFIMVSVIGFIRSFIPYSKIKKLATTKNKFLGYVGAGIFGAVTPFCSCSSIPIFLSMLRAGVPMGVSFSFLASSPLVDQYIAVIMLTIFGWKITLAYVLVGIIIGIFAGIVVEKLGMEKYLEKDIALKAAKLKDEKHKNLESRLIYGIKDAWQIMKKLWLWIMAGVMLGALIHNLVPAEFIQATISKGGIFVVPLAVLLGIPVYVSCSAVLPIAVVLFQKGIPIGTVLAFTMSTVALSLPEAVMLRRAMKSRLIALFFIIVAVGIMLSAYLLNFLQPLLV
jgi:uncharacterized membrane protein YraQ (UPF0718 family)